MYLYFRHYNTIIMQDCGLKGGCTNVANFITANHTINSTYSPTVGFIAAGISTLLFGSTLVPVKKFDCGDGMFLSFFMLINRVITYFLLS